MSRGIRISKEMAADCVGLYGYAAWIAERGLRVARDLDFWQIYYMTHDYDEVYEETIGMD